MSFCGQGGSSSGHRAGLRRFETLAQLKQVGVSIDKKILEVVGPIEKEETRQKLVDETIKKFGRLDVLVNNAGLSHRSDLGDPNSLENLDYVLNVNVKSLMAMTRLCIPHLEKTKGNVVNISSIGSTWCVPSLTPYQLTKGGYHYTRNASIEYAQVGVRVNAVRPGVITTNFGARHGPPSDQSLAWYERRPQQRHPNAPLRQSARGFECDRLSGKREGELRDR
ncbi:FabG [Aphelenchoides fujianensis]|nr:FabG [Aphelenchoides fujianensis]